jgi:nitronate monooxygenase
MPRDLREMLRQPLVVAPMGGGPSTPELVVAAAESGALGMLAGGYKTAEAVLADVVAVRAATAEAFGVNLFVPGLALLSRTRFLRAIPRSRRRGRRRGLRGAGLG